MKIQSPLEESKIYDKEKYLKVRYNNLRKCNINTKLQESK